MSHKNKVNHIVNTFPALAAHTDMVEFILDIREAFNLEKVPFEVRVGNWSSGSLDKYYTEVERQRTEDRLQAEKKNKKNTKRRGSTGWKRY